MLSRQDFLRMCNAISEFNDDCEVFHQYMMDEGVKAYRCNDGWVDRENNIATFHDTERDPGYYWYGEANVGDKIFIGNAHDFGYYAIVTEIVERLQKFGSVKYRFQRIS